MPKVQSLLVGTDFSEESGHAAARASLLGADLGCDRGTLAHVQEPGTLASLNTLLGRGAPAAEDVRKALAERLAAASEEAVSGSFRLRPELLAGRPHVELSRLAAEHDLVVLGARGSHYLRERLVGTLPQRLLGRMNKPLLVVRHAPEASYGSILVGVDFSEDSQHAITWARTIAPDAHLHLVHSFRHSQELAMHYANVTPGLIAEYREQARQRSEAELLRFVGSIGVPEAQVTPWVEEGDPAMGLCRRAAEVGSNLIVVGKRGTSEAADLLFGSVTQRLLGEARCDLLVTPHL
ncbi:MAG: universal stress protein [Gammaproteobacteria bacterium]|nr:MAG: universal stress protein [Gammaproteobacteria bacterium]